MVPFLVSDTQTLIATALLMGMDHATRKINTADTEIPPLPFEEAVSFMKGRVPMTKTEWNELEPKLRFRAFTVARLAQCDFIETVRGRLINAMEKGEGFASTWSDIKAIAEADGAFQFRPGYWENVFRTNTQTAYTAGKLMQYRDNPPPAWNLLIVDDSRTSDICRGLIHSGKQSLAMPSNHPFWEKFGFPPYHFQCRTGLQAVYSSQIGTDIQVENPTMKSLGKHFKPMEGFGGNPIEKESFWNLTDGMVARANKYGIGGDVLDFAESLGIDINTPNSVFSKLVRSMPSIINMGTLSDKLPKDFIDEMRKKLESAPQEIQKAWNNMVGDLKVVETNTKPDKNGIYPAFYKPSKDPAKRGVYFNIKDARNATIFNGIKLAPEHSKTFHELFHNLSHAASLRTGIDKDFTYIFVSEKHGITLTEMLKKEADEKIQSVLKSLKDEAVKNGLKRSSVLRKDAIAYLNKELRAIPAYEQFSLSDIWDGATNGKIWGRGQHSISYKGYWNRTGVGVEAFPIMADGAIHHPESLKRIKEYFPKSYEIFLEILNFIGGLK
jgi:hypothetical protein